MLKPTSNPKTFPIEKECLGPWSNALGANIGATAYQPPLPPYRVGSGLHFISGLFKVGLGWLVNAYSSYHIHMGGGV